MVTWGILSGATALSTGPYSFLTARFLLGVAEAGFFPGIVLFLTYWFPDRHRARIMAGFTLALPGAGALGAPISTALLGLGGIWGLAGWEGMGIPEGGPPLAVRRARRVFLSARAAAA